MAEPTFQVMECTSPVCGLRFSTDLSASSIGFCPKCGQKMEKVGEPYSNHRDSSTHPQKLETNLHVVLDNLRSSQNVGSIFRSSDGAGVAKVYCCGITPTPNQASVRKSSLSAEDNVQWSYHTNSKVIVETLAIHGLMIIVLESTHTSISLDSLTKDQINGKPLALIFGNEISGVDPEIVKSAHLVVHIPMRGEKTSLNVAVAAGVALFKFHNLLE